MTKKKEDKHDTGTITVNREEFKQTRDTFLSSFVVLQDAIRDLTSNYIKHTNTVLGDAGSNIDSVLKDLGEVAGAAAAAGRSTSPDKNGKEKKPKRAHDPNAPKRPLTPFFLYMQTARPIITVDLGPEAKKGAVADEGNRRWRVMGPDDRASWQSAYQDNLKLYNARMACYKAGNLAARNMTDDEARVYYDEHLAIAGDGDHAADAQLVNEALANDIDPDVDAIEDPDVEEEAAAEADVDADGEDEEEEVAPPVETRVPTPPPKTPKVKASRKKATPKTQTPAPPPTPIVVAAQAPEPEKKRKRKTKAEIDREKAAAADAPVDSIEREELLVQTPAAPKSSKPKKKKAKSDV